MGVVLVLVLVELLQPTRCRAREGWTGGRTPTSTTSVFVRWGGVAGEDQGTTKGTFEVQLSTLRNRIQDFTAENYNDQLPQRTVIAEGQGVILCR